MSNSLSIAAVTAALANLLRSRTRDQELAGTEFTTKTPRQGEAQPHNQLNVFLYQTSINAAWRNTDIPSQVRPGESSNPPLALNLHYLLTAYGENNDDLRAHRLLGRAMTILHDNPVLDHELLRHAIEGSDLHEQVDRVRVTPLPWPASITFSPQRQLHLPKRLLG